MLGLALVAAGCGGSEEPPPEPAAAPPVATTEPPEPATTTEPASPEERAPPGAPKFIAGYRGWPKLNERPIGPRDSDPHLGTKNVYVSEAQRANGRFPNGTIVVKEATRPGKDFIGLLATMRKERGVDPEHNDWIFVEYTREAANKPFSELARGTVCWSCHVGAADSDYVFTAG
jgi:Cytochrome P460